MVVTTSPNGSRSWASTEDLTRFMVAGIGKEVGIDHFHWRPGRTLTYVALCEIYATIPRSPHLTIHPSIYLSMHLPIYASIYHLSSYLSMHLSILPGRSICIRSTPQHSAIVLGSSAWAKGRRHSKPQRWMPAVGFGVCGVISPTYK